MLLVHHMVNQKLAPAAVALCFACLCSYHNMQYKRTKNRAVPSLLGFLVEHCRKVFFPFCLCCKRPRKENHEEENSSAKMSFCVMPNNKLENLVQFCCLWVWLLRPMVYENVDVRFKGDIIHVGLLHRNSICKLVKYIHVDGLNDATCQGNEWSIVLSRNIIMATVCRDDVS